MINLPARHDLYADCALKLQTNKHTNLASFCTKKMHYLILLKINQDVHWGDKENY